MNNRFNSFTELSKHKKEGENYKITVQEVSGSKVSVVAPHGGNIEWRTAEIAASIAANDHNLYTFEALEDQRHAFYELHVRSSNFDEPRCNELIAKTETTVTIHGCYGTEPVIYLGGLDQKLKSTLAEEFNKQGIKAVTEGHHYMGAQPDNICNKNKQKKGVQLEFSKALRDDDVMVEKCVAILRKHLKPAG